MPAKYNVTEHGLLATAFSIVLEILLLTVWSSVMLPLSAIVSWKRHNQTSIRWGRCWSSSSQSWRPASNPWDDNSSRIRLRCNAASHNVHSSLDSDPVLTSLSQALNALWNSCKSVLYEMRVFVSIWNGTTNGSFLTIGPGLLFAGSNSTVGSCRHSYKCMNDSHIVILSQGVNVSQITETFDCTIAWMTCNPSLKRPDLVQRAASVSYTHLTLPTILRV